MSGERHAGALRRLAISIICGLLALGTVSTEALADRRVALIIGNSAYQTVGRLPNPTADADAMAGLFKKAGFEVVDVRHNLNNLEFKRSIRRFSAAVIDADIAVVYYAGHGMEVGGVNYLIPTDAKLAVDLDAEDEALQLDRVMKLIEPARKLQLIILDACRDNPFGASMKRTVATRSVANGLADIAPTSSNVLVAYAAKAGSTAEDGYGANSPFTTALLRNLTQPNLDIRLAFGRVRDEVLRNTANRQEPYVYGSLGAANISLVNTSAPAKAESEADIKGDYDLVERIGSVKAWEVFLKTHSQGLYADLARMQIARLQADQPATLPRDASFREDPQQPSGSELVTRAQKELTRIGCYSGAPDGKMSDTTRAALTRYRARRGQTVAVDAAITESLIREMQQQPQGCVTKPATAAKPAPARPATAAAKPSAPPAREQAPPRPVAQARPGTTTMTGVGF